MAGKRPRVLAVASGGGHWVQLCRLRPAFEGCDVLFVSTDPGFARDVAPAKFASVPDANRSKKLRVLWMFARMGWIVLRHRPAAVVTTGAAPGYAAIRFARLLGARTMWIDSVANAEELSLSGMMAGKVADEWLTQWEHLGSGDPQQTKRGAPARTPLFKGAVL